MGSQPSGSTKQTTTAVPWAPQGNQLESLFQHAENYLNQGPAPVFTGPRVADQTPAQQQAASMLTRNVGALNQQAQQAQQSVGQLLTASDVGNNPVVQDAIQAALNPLARQFTEKVMPSLRIGGIDGGNTSSSRQGVIEAMAARDFNETSSNLIGRLMGDFYKSGLDAQTRGVALSPSIANLTNLGGQTLAQVGDAEQAYQQTLINAAMQEEVDRANQMPQFLSNFRNLITGGFGGTTTSPTGVQNPSDLGSLIGGGMSGYALGHMVEASNPWLWAAGGLLSSL